MMAKLGLLAPTLLFFAGVTTALGAGNQIPEGPGSNLVYGKCQTCHSLQYVVEAKGLLPAQWKSVLASMQDYGLEVSDQEKSKILDYLANYLGPNPPPKSNVENKSNQAKPAAVAAIDGAKLFQTNCSACHQSNGQGVAGQFPPLAGNTDLFLSRTFPANVVLFGLQGEIKTEGKTVASVMPPVAYLSDAEIAAVLHYVRTAWGNDKLRPPGFKPIDAAAVAEVRKHPLSPDQVRELRAKLKAGVK